MELVFTLFGLAGPGGKLRERGKLKSHLALCRQKGFGLEQNKLNKRQLI